jgi:hypothetical protein
MVEETAVLAQSEALASPGRALWGPFEFPLPCKASLEVSRKTLDFPNRNFQEFESQLSDWKQSAATVSNRSFSEGGGKVGVSTLLAGSCSRLTPVKRSLSERDLTHESSRVPCKVLKKNGSIILYSDFNREYHQ